MNCRSIGRTIASIAASALILLSCLPTAAAADDAVTLQLSGDIAGAHPLNLAWQAFSDQVGKDTGGAVTIKFFPAAQLYTGARAVEALATGAIAMAAVSTPQLVGLVPAFDVFQLPFFAPSSADESRLSAPDQPLFQYLAAQAATKGVVLLPCPWWGAGQHGIAIRQATPFKALSDIKGMKIRSPGGPTYGEIVRQLGASSIELAPTEVPSALQTGAIDGAIGSFEFFETALSDSAKGAVDTGGLTLAGYYVLVNKGIWDKIPARDQQIIIRDLQASHKTYDANLPKNNAEVVAKLKATGHWVYQMTPVEATNLATSMRPMWQQYSAKQPAVYEAFIASRKRLGFDK